MCPCCDRSSLEVCLHATVLNTVDPKLKDQVGTLDLHVQLEI